MCYALLPAQLCSGVRGGELAAGAVRADGEGQGSLGLLGCLVQCVARARQPPDTTGYISLPSTPLTAKVVVLWVTWDCHTSVE